MHHSTARSSPVCLASLFVSLAVPMTRPYHEKPSSDGVSVATVADSGRSGSAVRLPKNWPAAWSREARRAAVTSAMPEQHRSPYWADDWTIGPVESGRPLEPCCGVPEWTRRCCAPRPRRCGIPGSARSSSLSPRSARPRSASSPPWSSATSAGISSRSGLPGAPSSCSSTGPSSRAGLPAQRSQEGPRCAGYSGGARSKVRRTAHPTARPATAEPQLLRSRQASAAAPLWPFCRCPRMVRAGMCGGSSTPCVLSSPYASPTW